VLSLVDDSIVASQTASLGKQLSRLAANFTGCVFRKSRCVGLAFGHVVLQLDIVLQLVTFCIGSWMHFVEANTTHREAWRVLAAHVQCSVFGFLA
jgi:hypothetical protein